MLNGFAKDPSAAFPFVFRHCDLKTWRRAQGARLREIGLTLFCLVPSALRLEPFCIRHASRPGSLASGAFCFAARVRVFAR